MVAPAQPQPNEQTQNALFDPRWAAAQLRSLFMQRGINPSGNLWAQQILKRANEASYMMNAMGLDAAQAPAFLQAWLNGRWGSSAGGAAPGGSSQFNGTDLSRAGMGQWLDTAMRGTVNDQSSEQAKDQYAFFNTGDPFADFENLTAAEGIKYGSRAPGYQQAHQRVLDEWFGNAQSQMQQNPNLSTNILDWRYNRAPVAAYNTAAPPPGQAQGQTQAYSTTPAAGTTAPAATPPAGWVATQNPASALGGRPYINVSGYGAIAPNRQGHPTAPGLSSADLGFGWVYDAPADVQRRYWASDRSVREPGDTATKGESGWRLFTNRMAQLQAQGMSYQQALQNTMQWLLNHAGSDLSKFGFRRVG